MGIFLYVTQDVLITNNVIHDTPLRGSGGVGIQTDATNATTIQNNEIYNIGIGTAKGDTSAYDADWGSVNSTIQYNYSHNNYAGFVETWEAHGIHAPNLPSPWLYSYVGGMIVRWNVSINDGQPATGVFWFPGNHLPYGICEAVYPIQCPSVPSNTGGPTVITNNTIFLDGTKAGPIITGDQPNQVSPVTLQVGITGIQPGQGTGRNPPPWCGGDGSHSCRLQFLNNIVVSGRWQAGDPYSWTSTVGAVFDYNTYWGPFSGLPNQTAGCGHDCYRDPVLAAPNALGASGEYPPNGSMVVGGMKLGGASPLQQAGFNNGYIGLKDFWGKAVCRPVQCVLGQAMEVSVEQ